MGTHRPGTTAADHLMAPCPSVPHPDPHGAPQCPHTPRLSIPYSLARGLVPGHPPPMPGLLPDTQAHSQYLGTSLAPGVHPRYPGTSRIPRHTPDTLAQPHCPGTSPMSGHIPDAWAHPGYPDTSQIPKRTPIAQAHPQCWGTSLHTHLSAPPQTPHPPATASAFSACRCPKASPSSWGSHLGQGDPWGPCPGRGMLHPAPAPAPNPQTLTFCVARCFVSQSCTPGTALPSSQKLSPTTMAPLTQAPPRHPPQARPPHPQNGARMGHPPPQPPWFLQRCSWHR